MTARTLLPRLLVLAAIAQPVFAQVSAEKPLAYDAVSIKPNKSGSGSTSVHIDDVHYHASNVSLKSLLRDAYDLQSEDQVVGLPAWTNSTHFDIEAKIDAETLATLKAAPKAEGGRMRNEMMKAVLAERFQLKVHPETKELPMYDLVLAKGGSKLKTAAPAEGGSTNSNNQKLTATNIPISNLGNYLSRRLHRQVTDKTGLTGKYDFTLEWSPDEAAGESPAAAGSEQLPTLFTALQEQLGLNLESTKGPVDTIVVDKVEMPSEN